MNEIIIRLWLLYFGKRKPLKASMSKSIFWVATVCGKWHQGLIPAWLTHENCVVSPLASYDRLFCKDSRNLIYILIDSWMVVIDLSFLFADSISSWHLYLMYLKKIYFEKLSFISPSSLKLSMERARTCKRVFISFDKGFLAWSR